MPLTLAEIEARLLARPQPSAALFSRRILNLSPDDGRVEAEFDVPTAFAAPTGHVQGGFIAAILDDLAALAAIIHADQPIIVPTLTFTVNFLAPVPLGRIRGIGQCMKLGRRTTHLQAQILDMQGDVLATMTATGAPRPL